MLRSLFSLLRKQLLIPKSHMLLCHLQCSLQMKMRLHSLSALCTRSANRLFSMHILHTTRYSPRAAPRLPLPSLPV